MSTNIQVYLLKKSLRLLEQSTVISKNLAPCQARRGLIHRTESGKLRNLSTIPL